MSTARDELALRKDLLLAQSALYRAQLGFEVLTLRKRVTRGADWIERGMTILAIVRTLISVVRSLRR